MFYARQPEQAIEKSAESSPRMAPAAVDACRYGRFDLGRWLGSKKPCSSHVIRLRRVIGKAPLVNEIDEIVAVLSRPTAPEIRDRLCGKSPEAALWAFYHSGRSAVVCWL
jgi:hypothetical protein